MRRLLLLVVAALLVSRGAHAQLFDPPVTDAGEALDPQPLYGDPIARGARPDAPGWPSACSFRVPACVHAQPGTAGAQIVGALASLERAWDTAANVLHVPPPDAGETGAYRVYLVDRDGATPSATLVAARDVRAGLDRASAFSLVDRALTGCPLEDAIARELVRASIYRMAPATDEGTARAEASYVARLVVPCAMSLPDGVETFQANPERALVEQWKDRGGRIADAYERGAALFFWWLDWSFGEQPADLLRGFWSICPTTTPADALAWRAHPNGFDVLRVTFAGAFGAGTSVDDLYVRFAIARAFMGSADDGAHLPESRALGGAGLVTLAWGTRGGPDLAWPAEPRAYASSDGLSQTGAGYLLVHHDGAPAGAAVQVEAKWEAFTRMRWVAVKLGEGGKNIGESTLAGFDRGKDARVLVRDLDATHDLLIIGVSLGDWTHRFDPADVAWWSHGWAVSLYPK